MDGPVLDLNTENDIASSAWVVVASLYQARLLRFHTPLTKSCRFEQRGQIEAPMPAGASDRYAAEPGSIGKPYQARYQQLQAEYRRFARQLSHWLKDLSHDEAIERVTVFAPKQLMQGLHNLAAELRPTRVDLQAGNLMNTYDDELRRHPAVLSLLKSQQADQQSSDMPIRKIDRPRTDSNRFQPLYAANSIRA